MTPTARLARLLPDVRPDGALLAAFLADRDEAAFAELVRRHGPVVLAACRRLLPDPADAADAFQAAFLVLVRRARRLTGSAELGPWLYRVAAWTARNVRRKNARRLARSAPLSDHVPAPPTSPVAALDLDAALLALPEKYRAALVLCHLQGWSRRDAAARLGCPEGTLSSLLARGLSKLKARLPGYEPVVVPAALVASTVFAAARPVPSVVADLAAAVLRALWVPKATAAAVGVAAVFALGAGVGVSVREAPAVAQVPTAPAPREKAPDKSQARVDRLHAYRDDAARQYQRLVEELDRLALELDAIEARFARGELTPAESDRLRADRLTARLTAMRLLAPLRKRIDQLSGQLEEAEERLTFAARRAGADVTGILAVEVTFPDDGRYWAAVAARDLVELATDRADGGAAAWDAARRLSHVHVRFPAPHRAVREVALVEVLVPLPLTREPGGFVLVRDGGRVVRYSKFPAAAAVRFQEALSAAVPAGLP